MKCGNEIFQRLERGNGLITLPNPDRYQKENAIASITARNQRGWPVNSSFSNQRLFGFVAKLDPAHTLNQASIGSFFATGSSPIAKLLEQLHCLQCHTVLLEWLHSSTKL